SAHNQTCAPGLACSPIVLARSSETSLGNNFRVRVFSLSTAPCGTVQREASHPDSARRTIMKTTRLICLIAAVMITTAEWTIFLSLVAPVEASPLACTASDEAVPTIVVTAHG